MAIQMTANEYAQKYGSAPSRTTASGSQIEIPIKMTLADYNKKYSQVPETISTEPKKSFGQKMKDFFTEATSKSAYDILYQKDADKMNLDTVNSFSNSIKTLIDRNKTEQDEQMRKKREQTIKNLIEQQQNIAGQAGGEIAGKTNSQLVGQSVMTALELTPFLGFKSLSTALIKGAVNTVGKTGAKELVKKELEKEIEKKGTSFLTKEFATTLPKTAMVEAGLFGTIAGGASEMGNKDATIPSIIGNAIKTGAISAVLGLGLAKGGQYVANKISKKKVDSTVSAVEKELGTAFPEESKKIVESAVENGATKNEIVSSIKDKRKELSLNVIANTSNGEVIAKSLEGIVDVKDVPTLAKALKYVDTEADVAKMIDEFSPDVQKKKLVESLSLAETDREVASLLKGRVSPESIPEYVKIFKTLKDENTIAKVLDDIPPIEQKVPKQETPKQTTPEPTPTTPTSPVEKSSIKSDTQVPEEKISFNIAKKMEGKSDDVVLNEYQKDVKNYRETGIGFEGNKQPMNASLLRLQEFSDLPTVKKEVSKNTETAIKNGDIKPNADGTITVYRVGGVPKDGRLTSVTYSKDYAKEFSKGEKQIEEFKIKKEDIKTFIGKDESELLVSSNSLKKEPVKGTPNTAPKKEAPKETSKKESQFAKDFEREAIEKGILNDTTLVAEYTPGIRKEQAKIVSKILVDKERTLKILKGEEGLPEGIKDLAFVGGVRKYALDSNDFELADALRRSEFATKTSETGSELSMLVGTKSNFDEKIASMEKARIEAYKAKTGGDAEKALQEEIKKFKAKEITEDDILSFIKDIKC